MKIVRVVVLSFLSIILSQSHILCSKNTKTVFLHGIGGSHKCGLRYKKQFIPDELITFDCYDVEDLSQSQLVGTQDISHLRKQIKDNKGNASKIALMGLSRGASTALYWAASATKAEKKLISCVIAESPLARYSDVVKNFPEHLRTNISKQPSNVGLKILYGLTYALQGLVAPLPEDAADYLMKLRFPQCDPNHDLLSVVTNIPPFIPVLLICSEEDTLIPATSTIKLYKQLKMANHPRVHLFVAKHGEHVRIASGPDGRDYILIVNAFRKHYNLPHFEYKDEEVEERANLLFAETQPGLQELEM